MQILKWLVLTTKEWELLEKDVREWGQVKFMIEKKYLKINVTETYTNILLMLLIIHQPASEY